MTEPEKKSGRGGARPGAGRKPKGYVKPAALPDIELLKALGAEPPAEIDVLAQAHAPIALEALVQILLHEKKEMPRIAAAKEILDRGFGKPTVEIGGDAPMLPYMMAPENPATKSARGENQEEAKKFGPAAVVVLRSIAAAGSSAMARFAAAKALLDRSFGTVGKARMPEELRDRPLGKKEELARAAEVAASGPYATPAPPRQRFS
ncbi:MAG TPA: hypothetical protein VMU18_10095 [Rhodoblastus sp.]|nr:hypothetical protein [Rhodoblastus sp.]